MKKPKKTQKPVAKKTAPKAAKKAARPAKAKQSSKAASKAVVKAFPKYDPAKIEKKWQKFWKDKKFYKADDKRAATEPHSNKFFGLVEFPFPSGAGLHTGHTRSYTAMDVISRKRRAQGQNVLFPIGWDAFGLPTENYAIKTGIPPQKATKQNTDTFRRQLQSLGISFDWSREVNTTDPAYYKWTQWIFLQMYKKGLAYKSKMTINWCPKDKIGLANEEVINGHCERCGTAVEKRDKEQWMLAITKYADRLDKDLDTVDYWEKIKIQQRNWIGRSEGAEVAFKLKAEGSAANDKSSIDPNLGEMTVFTTRIDTLFGVTYVVLAPESELVQKLKGSIANFDEVEAYIKVSQKKDDMDRTAEGKEKTGVQLKGIVAINPANGEEVQVWTADYVLASYGTGAVMAVPAHDERDFAFAKKFGLPIRNVIAPDLILTGADAPRAGVETLDRECVDIILENEKGEFLLIAEDANNVPHLHFVGGGTDGDDPKEAAKRELVEETGYVDFEILEKVDMFVYTYAFRHTKNVNQTCYGYSYHAKLLSDKRIDSEVEEGKHKLVWMKKEEILEKLTWPDHKAFWNTFLENGASEEEGKLFNSGKFDGMTSAEAKTAIAKEVGAKIVTKYKLRDWIFSRQRYWGEPIPMVSCEKCGWVPVPEKDLPVKLPPVKKYEPTDNGESPLAAISSWVNTKCPQCKGKAKRETDTMPNWAGSSWYFLRYIDPKNNKALADDSKIKNWMQVDWYNGGMEHTTLHLLYSRFWHKFLYDIGVVNTAEPYAKRTSHGLILAEGGVKMSKSIGNVVNPDDLVKLYGADTLRVYQLFMGPFDQAIAWNTSSMIGSRRFVERVYDMAEKIEKSGATGAKISKGSASQAAHHADGVKNAENSELESLLHRTIKKVGDDIESLGFNTAVSSLMILLNAFEKEIQDRAAATGSLARKDEKAGALPRRYYETLLKLLAPFAPHVADELWAHIGNKKSVHLEAWPTYDVSKLQSSTFKIVVQINSKVRTTFMSSTDDEESVKKQASALPEVRARMLDLAGGDQGRADASISGAKVFYVKGKLINFVIA